MQLLVEWKYFEQRAFPVQAWLLLEQELQLPYGDVLYYFLLSAEDNSFHNVFPDFFR